MCSGRAVGSAAQQLWDALCRNAPGGAPALASAAESAIAKAPPELDPRVKLYAMVRARKMKVKAKFELNVAKNSGQALCRLRVGEHECEAGGAGKRAAKKA